MLVSFLSSSSFSFFFFSTCLLPVLALLSVVADNNSLLSPPPNFSLSQRNLLNYCETYYTAMRDNSPHSDCHPVASNQTNHVLCQPSAQSLIALTPSDIQPVLDLLLTKYSQNAPEGSVLATSFFPQPGFAQHGQMRFQDGVQQNALFWTLEHGLGCPDANPTQWCVTVVVKDVNANMRMHQLITQPIPSQKQVQQMEKDNLAKFEKKAKAEISARETVLRQQAKMNKMQDNGNGDGTQTLDEMGGQPDDQQIPQIDTDNLYDHHLFHQSGGPLRFADETDVEEIPKPGF